MTLIRLRTSDFRDSIRPMYILFDANVIAAYYLPQSTKSTRLVQSARTLIESVRRAGSNHFLYVPNFCIAEVFGVFAKYNHGAWNIKEKTIDGRIYNSVREQFQKDIHNAKLFYHYELSRYHILATNLVAPIDHKYPLRKKTMNAKGKLVYRNGKPTPAGTFDQLIVAMGVHLVKIHGHDSVCLLTADDRLESVVKKCKSNFSHKTKRKLHLTDVEKLTGVPFAPESFPRTINLKRATDSKLKSVFGEWPPPAGIKREKRYLANIPKK